MSVLSPSSGTPRVVTWASTRGPSGRNLGAVYLGDQSTERKEYIPGEGTNRLRGTSFPLPSIGAGAASWAPPAEELFVFVGGRSHLCGCVCGLGCERAGSGEHAGHA
eukprot:1193264-Prorocentrum_minimum.AAC.2